MTWYDITKKIMETQGEIALRGDKGVMQPTSMWARMSVDQTSIIEKVLCELKISNATDQELEERLGISGNSIRPSRGQCVKKKWVVPTGETRRTKTGRLANVWELTQKGIEKATEVMEAN